MYSIIECRHQFAGGLDQGKIAGQNDGTCLHDHDGLLDRFRKRRRSTNDRRTWEPGWVDWELTLLRSAWTYGNPLLLSNAEPTVRSPFASRSGEDHEHE